jgi:hypothetical protein
MASVLYQSQKARGGTIMKAIGIIARLALAACALTGAAYAQNGGCSNGTIAGTYIFTITGQILAPSAAAGPVSGVAMTTFDGFGNLTQVDHVVHNGVTPVEDWRPATGTYSVNPDCTGTFSFFPMPTVAADNSPAIKVYFVICKGGLQINTVVSGSPNTPLFVASILSTGTRIY